MMQGAPPFLILAWLQFWAWVGDHGMAEYAQNDKLVTEAQGKELLVEYLSRCCKFIERRVTMNGRTNGLIARMGYPYDQ